MWLMPKIDSLDQAGLALAKAANVLKAVGERLGPQQARRATSVDAVYAMLSDLGSQLAEAGKELGNAATKLRNASAELESLDEA
jgi:hypothetical protein